MIILPAIKLDLTIRRLAWHLECNLQSSTSLLAWRTATCCKDWLRIPEDFKGSEVIEKAGNDNEDAGRLVDRNGRYVSRLADAAGLILAFVLDRPAFHTMPITFIMYGSTRLHMPPSHTMALGMTAMGMSIPPTLLLPRVQRYFKFSNISVTATALVVTASGPAWGALGLLREEWGLSTEWKMFASAVIVGLVSISFRDFQPRSSSTSYVPLYFLRADRRITELWNLVQLCQSSLRRNDTESASEVSHWMIKSLTIHIEGSRVIVLLPVRSGRSLIVLPRPSTGWTYHPDHWIVPIGLAAFVVHGSWTFASFVEYRLGDWRRTGKEL